MALTLVNGQPGQRDFEQSDAQALRAREVGAEPHIGLTSLDRLALDSLVDPHDVPALVAAVKDSATALAGADRNEARVRLIARAVASERARQLVLEGALDERLLARDFEGVAAIDKVLTATVKRLAVLLGEHRAACSAGHRATVLVGHADAVHVDGGDR